MSDLASGESRKRYMINTKMVDIEGGRLPPDQRVVKSLAESIKKIGLINPITVYRKPLGGNRHKMVLVAGRNRLEAHKLLNRKDIWAIVEEDDSPTVETWLKLAEIDENLFRRDLSAAVRAKLTAERKKLYLKEHPETGHGAVGRGGRKKDADSASFVEDTATKIGRSKRSVEVDAHRGSKLGGELLSRIAGTSLDKGEELDALEELTKAEREKLAKQAAAGRNVTARKEPKDPGTPGYAKLRTAWNAASEAGRRKFVDEFKKQISKLM